MLLISLSSALGKHFVIGVEELDYFPHYTIKDGKYVGYAREVLDLFAKKHGHAFKYVPKPVRRNLKELQNDNIDFYYPENPHWYKNQDLKNAMIYSGPVTIYIDGVMVPKEKLGKGVDSLRILGIPSGFTPVAYLNLVEEQKIKISEIPRITNLLRQTKLGFADGAYLNIDVAHHRMRNLKNSDKLYFDKSLPYAKGAFQLATVNHPEIIRQFNSFLSDEKLKINSLKKKYRLSGYKK